MSQTALKDEHFSRAGGAVAGLFSALPFAAIAGATLLAPATALAGLIAAPWGRLPRVIAAGGLPLVMLLAFMAWAGASSAWARPPSTPALMALIAGAAASLLVVLSAGLARRADADLAHRAGVTGVGALLALLAIEAAFDFPISRALTPPAADLARHVAPVDSGEFLANAQRGAALAAVWIWGAAAILIRFGWPGRIGAASLFAGALWLASNLPDPLLAPAIALGGIAAAAALRWPRGAVSVTALTAALAVMVAPGVLPTFAALAAQAYHAWRHVDPPFSWFERIDTWSFTTGMIRQRIFTGWGFGASWTFTQTHSLGGYPTPYIDGYPHNAAMQIWLETGGVGAALAAGALAAFGRRAGAALAQDRWAAAAASGAIASALVFAMLDMNAWAQWWWVGLAIGAALVRCARVAP